VYNIKGSFNMISSSFLDQEIHWNSKNLQCFRNANHSLC